MSNFKCVSYMFGFHLSLIFSWTTVWAVDSYVSMIAVYNDQRAPCRQPIYKQVCHRMANEFENPMDRKVVEVYLRTHQWPCVQFNRLSC